MNYLVKEFIIQKLQEFIPYDIRHLFYTSIQFKEFGFKYVYLKLNPTYSSIYCCSYTEYYNYNNINTGMTFYNYINSQIKTNKQLSVNIYRGSCKMDLSCNKITDEVVINRLGNCHTLNLSNCYKISDEGLKYLALCHTLNLFECNDITDKGLKYLENCNTIYLDVSFTKNITENCIINLGNIFIQVKPLLGYYDSKIQWKPYNKKDYENLFRCVPTVYNVEQYEYKSW